MNRFPGKREETRARGRGGRPPAPLNPDASAAARLGAELRSRRQARDMTQDELGRLVGFSSQHVGAAERAATTVSEQFIAACDDALGANGALVNLLPTVVVEQASERHRRQAHHRSQHRVPPPPSTGPPRVAYPAGTQQSQPETHTAERELVKALFSYERPGVEPPGLAAAWSRVARAWSLYQASRLDLVRRTLPELLADARLVVDASSPAEQAKARSVLALAYHLASTYLKKRGDHELALVVADRGMTQAQQAERPVIVGMLYRAVAHALNGGARWDDAIGVTMAAASYLRPRLRRPSPLLLSVYGTLHLNAVISAARANDRATTRDLLGEARAAAEQLGTDRNDLWTAFGPTNVAIHHLAQAVELGDRRLAAKLAPAIRPMGLPLERQARHAIDVARAYSGVGRDDDAIGMLMMAEQTAPEQIHSHPLARELVRDLLGRHRAPVSSPLRSLAPRLGIDP